MSSWLVAGTLAAATELESHETVHVELKA